MFAAATSFCGLPRYCTLLFSWKTHNIKLCPLPAGTSKYNCYKGDVFVCNVLPEILRQFQQNCRNLRSSSSEWIPLNKNQLQHRQEERNKHSSDCFVTLECRLIVQKFFQWHTRTVLFEGSMTLIQYTPSKKHLFLFNGKGFRNLLNKKVTLRVYRIQEMENTSRLTPLSRGSSLNRLLCWYGFTFHRKRWYSVFAGWYLGRHDIN